MYTRGGRTSWAEAWLHAITLLIITSIVVSFIFIIVIYSGFDFTIALLVALVSFLPILLVVIKIDQFIRKRLKIRRGS